MDFVRKSKTIRQTALLLAVAAVATLAVAVFHVHETGPSTPCSVCALVNVPGESIPSAVEPAPAAAADVVPVDADRPEGLAVAPSCDPRGPPAAC